MAIFDITYVGDMPYLKLEGGTVTGATIFNSSVTANSGSITNNLAVGSINGVTVGQNPKFTDTTYSVATTSVAGLMSTTDRTAVDKVGTGTLNTTNKTIIPAINELKSTDSSLTTRIAAVENIINTTPSTAPPEIRNFYDTTTSNSDSGWGHFTSKTFTAVGAVGDTVLVYVFSYNLNHTRTITVSSGFTQIDDISWNNSNYVGCCFMKYKTAASETITVNFSGSSYEYGYPDYAAVIVIKGRYNIENNFSKHSSGTLSGAYSKPHQGYYIYMKGKSTFSETQDGWSYYGGSGTSNRTCAFDKDSTRKAVDYSGGSTDMNHFMAVCLQRTADWGGGELPKNMIVTTSTNTNPASALGYGTWTAVESGTTTYRWKRTS